MLEAVPAVVKRLTECDGHAHVAQWSKDVSAIFSGISWLRV